MGRKTNSVSLRLGKTNRDYNNCWYGDLLYSENFSKSLKIENYLSQTLKTAGMPCPKSSLIGAFKKANLLICYLDPLKRQRLLEKSNGASTQTLQRFPKTPNTTKVFFSLGSPSRIKKKSKAVLKPLQNILETSVFNPLALAQGERKKMGSYTCTDLSSSPDSTENFIGNTNANKQLRICKTKLDKKNQAHALATLTALAKHAPQEEQNSATKSPFSLSSGHNDQRLFPLEETKGKTKQQAFSIQKKKQFIRTGRALTIGIEFTQSKQPALNKPYFCDKHPVREATVTGGCVLTKNNQVNENNKLGALIRPSIFITSTCFLKGLFFVQKTKSKSLSFLKKEKSFFPVQTLPYCLKKNSPRMENHNVNLIKQEKAQGSLSFNRAKDDFPYSQSGVYSNSSRALGICREEQSQTSFALFGFPTPGSNSFPYVFENSALSVKFFRFQFFSNFFYNEKNNLRVLCAFNKNFKTFANRETLTTLGLSNNAFALAQGPKAKAPFSDFSFTTGFSSIKNNQNNLDQKQKRLKKEIWRGSGLGGLYSGFSSFWENGLGIFFYKSINETSCALFLADTVSYLLEKRVSFRSIKRQLLLDLNQYKLAPLIQESPNKGVSEEKKTTVKTKTKVEGNFSFENKKKITGIRISCSGRVGGRSKKAQRSRKETFMWGQTGLHVFSSRLDFAKTHAETPFGVVGVQVWVCTK